MRAPEFWGSGGLPAALLAPAGHVWCAAARVRRRWIEPRRAPVPVICIGNLVAGGAGKTPLAMAVARRLADRGHVPHLLSRGHGGRLKGPVRVEAGRHTALEVGDEALLLARHAPAWVGADRVAGAQAASASGAGVLVMDDGFQNPRLHQDLALIAVDAGFGLGNGRVMPAGPLREAASDGLARADAVVLIGEDEGQARDRHIPAFPSLPPRPLLRAKLRPTARAAALRGEAVWAFAGIGRPRKFFDTLRRLGATVVARRAFPDHRRYAAREIEDMARAARNLRARLVTTEKDWVRLDPDARALVEAVPVELVFDDPAACDRLIDAVLEAPS